MTSATTQSVVLVMVEKWFVSQRQLHNSKLCSMTRPFTLVSDHKTHQRLLSAPRCRTGCYSLHIFTITAMLMAAYTGRLDLSIAGLFGAGKSRAAAVLLVGMLIVNPDVKVLVICKENSAARSFVQLLLSTSPPATVLKRLGRLVSDDEYSTNRSAELDVPPTDRNDSLKTKRALVATGGLLAYELKSRWTGIRTWSEDLTVFFLLQALCGIKPSR